MEPKPSSAEMNVPWRDVVRFVRQLNHDVRNHLNALELQAAFVKEIATELEVKEEIARLRETLATMATMLQKLSTTLADPKPNTIPYAAADLMADLQKKFDREAAERSPRVKWQTQATSAMLDVDPQLLQEALSEVIDNAFQFSPAETEFTIEAGEHGGYFAISLREPKENGAGLTTSTWGREPLKNARHGHYGLGLNRARAIFEAHGATFRSDYDAQKQALTTTILLPVSQARP